MIEWLPLFGTALLTGLLGSAHCLGMCVGISSMIAIGHDGATAAPRPLLAGAYNAGRVLSYMAIGALVGGFGSAFVALVPTIAGPVRLIGGLLIVLIGLQIALRWRILAPLERAGLSVWQRIRPIATHVLPVTSVPRAIGLGLLWGWLPCGLVYSVLLLAATTADVAAGAGTMLAFGIGTMPAMILTGIGGLRLSTTVGRHHRMAGLLIVVVGFLTIAMPLQSLLFEIAGTEASHMH